MLIILTFAVIADCMNYNSSVGKSEPEVVNHREKDGDIEMKLRSKISARKSFNDKKEARSYYKGISIDLLKTVDGEFTRLSELVKQNA